MISLLIFLILTIYISVDLEFCTMASANELKVRYRELQEDLAGKTVVLYK